MSDKPFEFVKVHPKCGDWEGWYMNGKLIAEGHAVRVIDFLDAINDVFPNTYKRIEISDEKAEMGYTENLDDMINN
jgi:hypothetical protein